jgi:excisionase family DNA binding protein
MTPELLSVDDAGLALGVSRSTVWRLIRRGELPSVRRAGRRFVPATAVRARTAGRRAKSLPEFTEAHPMFRLVGAGRGGGRAPGARDKHAILDE